ncbi:MAG TPA: aspartate kinase [Blastocatellia bacterium]|nr:aspartate kinase [Blastocatellia bacterium]
MIVMKFGGTSVEDAASIERVAEIIRARVSLRPAIVVSAMGKTTRKLLQAAEASAAGDSRTTLAIVADLKTRHTSEARQLVKDSSCREVFSIIERHFDELKMLLEGLAILGEVPPRGLDKILSYGELLSSAIVADALAERRIPARLMDARQFIKTDDRFGQASPLFDITNPLIQEALAPALEVGSVPVIQGFIGSTREGATTTLGFEGSDYTAAIVGAAMQADDIQIWKDVSGLMTADPKLFPGARTVKVCTFAEAADLTYFGAKVLHPKAIHPAAQRNIAVHIYNSKKPDATGTAITGTAPRCANLIKSIAYKRPVTVINAKGGQAADGARAVPPEDFLKTLLNALDKHRARPLITVVSASSVALAIDSSEMGENAGRDLMEEISRFAAATVEPNKAIVSLVGEELRSDTAMAGRVFKAIDEFELGVILHGSSPISMNLVVNGQDVEGMIARLHEVFFREPDPQIFE